MVVGVRMIRLRMIGHVMIRHVMIRFRMIGMHMIRFRVVWFVMVWHRMVGFMVVRLGVQNDTKEMQVMIIKQGNKYINPIIHAWGAKLPTKLFSAEPLVFCNIS